MQLYNAINDNESIILAYLIFERKTGLWYNHVYICVKEIRTV